MLFVTRPKLDQNQVLVFGFCLRKIMEFVTFLLGAIITFFFSWKNVSQIACTCFATQCFYVLTLNTCNIWGKVFKNEPSEICGRQPLKSLLGPFLHTMSHITVNINNLQNTLTKSSPIICTFARELSNCYDQFFRLSGFLDISSKVFFIAFKFALFEISILSCGQCKQIQLISFVTI